MHDVYSIERIVQGRAVQCIHTFCSDLFGAIATTSEYGHLFVTSNLSGLYVDMLVLLMASIRLYFPFHECFVTK